MAIFDKYKNNCSKLDWQILIRGSMVFYFRESILQGDIKWLEDHGYKIGTLDCGKLESIGDFHKKIKGILEFPEYYGENMAAFSDCLLSDLNVPDPGGFALVLKNFNVFYNLDRLIGHQILECLELNSKRHLLLGERCLTLIHTTDPNIQLGGVGEHSISWNSKEFLLKDRT